MECVRKRKGTGQSVSTNRPTGSRSKANTEDECIVCCESVFGSIRLKIVSFDSTSVCGDFWHVHLSHRMVDSGRLRSQFVCATASRGRLGSGLRKGTQIRRDGMGC